MPDIALNEGKDLVPRIQKLQNSALPPDFEAMFRRVISEFIPERDELTSILQNQSLRVLLHIEKQYRGRINEIDKILRAAERVITALENGFNPVSLAWHNLSRAGYLRDPGPIDEDLIFPAMRGKKFNHHRVFENLIPRDVLEKCKEAEPFFDSMLVFSEKDNFILYSDMICARLPPEVIKAKKQAFKMEDSCGVVVGILAMPPALKPRIDFNTSDRLIKDSCGFYITQWDLSKILES